MTFKVQRNRLAVGALVKCAIGYLLALYMVANMQNSDVGDTAVMGAVMFYFMVSALVSLAMAAHADSQIERELKDRYRKGAKCSSN